MPIQVGELLSWCSGMWHLDEEPECEHGHLRSGPSENRTAGGCPKMALETEKGPASKITAVNAG